MADLIPLAAVPGHYADRSDTCLVLDHERWTWADLDAASDLWADELRSRNVKAGDLVAYTLENGLEFFALTFGVYKLGATPAPLSPKLPVAELEDILEIMQPRTVVRNVDPRPGSPGPPPSPPWPISPSWKACTSGGSTGRPKVIVDHRPAAFDPGQSFIGLPRDDVVIVPGPLYHNAPFSAAILGLARGNRVVVSVRFDVENTLCLIEQEHAAWALLVPTMMHRIWRLAADKKARYDLSSLNCVVHTAAPMSAWLKRAWIEWLGPDRIWEVYGATEGLARTWIGGSEWLERPGSVGRPIGGARLAVLDDRGQVLPAGSIGEIFAMPPDGPGSTYHYIGAERRASENGWESVGDIGWIDEDGYLYLADRRSDLIISGGVNIFPAEVEAALLQHPQVLSCAAVGAPDDDLGQRVHAVLQLQGGTLDLQSLRAFLSDRLAANKHPRSMEIRSDPVRDDAGKVRRGQLMSKAS
jgi:bile acid-coenzyme A ligase